MTLNSAITGGRLPVWRSRASRSLNIAREWPPRSKKLTSSAHGGRQDLGPGGGHACGQITLGRLRGGLGLSGSLSRAGERLPFVGPGLQRQPVRLAIDGAGECVKPDEPCGDHDGRQPVKELRAQ